MASEAFALGAYTKMWWEPGTTAKADSYTFDASSEPYDFLAESMARHRKYANVATIRGTRMAHSLQRRIVKYEYFGEVVKYISPAELDTILPKALGPASPAGTYQGGNGTTFTEEEIPYFSALFQRDSGIFAAPATSIFQYDNCKIDRFIMRGRAEQGQELPSLVTTTLRIVACNQAEVSLPANLPALGTAANYAPYAFSDTESGITLVGVGSRPIQEFIIAWSNHATPKYVNALKPYAIRCMGRDVQLRFLLPWNDVNDDIYDAAEAGAAGIVKLTNGTMSATFNFGNLTIEDVTPTASKGRGEMEFIIDAVATGGTYDVQVVNDSTV